MEILACAGLGEGRALGLAPNEGSRSGGAGGSLEQVALLDADQSLPNRD